MSNKMIEINRDSMLEAMLFLKMGFICKKILERKINPLDQEELNDVLYSIDEEVVKLYDSFRVNYSRDIIPSGSDIKNFLRDYINSWELDRKDLDSGTLATLNDDIELLYDEIFHEAQKEVYENVEELLNEVLDCKNISICYEEIGEYELEFDVYGGYIYNVCIKDRLIIEMFRVKEYRKLAKLFISSVLYAVDTDADIMGMKVYEDKINLLVSSRGEGYAVMRGVVLSKYMHIIRAVIMYKYIDDIKKNKEWV